MRCIPTDTNPESKRLQGLNIVLKQQEVVELVPRSNVKLEYNFLQSFTTYPEIPTSLRVEICFDFRRWSLQARANASRITSYVCGMFSEIFDDSLITQSVLIFVFS